MVSSINAANMSTIYALMARQGANSAAKTAGSSGGAADSAATASTGQSSNTVSTYDFTDMTPNEMQGVASNLYASGQIDSTQLLHLQLMGVPVGKMGPNGTFVPLTDAERSSYMSQPYNYIQGLQGIVDNLQQTGYASDPKSGYEGWKNMLATLQKLQGTTSGVDIAA